MGDERDEQTAEGGRREEVVAVMKAGESKQAITRTGSTLEVPLPKSVLLGQ